MNTDGTRSPGITSRQSAIIAGAGLLLMAIIAPLANFAILQKLIDPGDIAGTTGNIIASEGAFRTSIGLFMGVALLDIIVAWALYIFLKPVNRHISLLAAWLRVVYAAMLAASLIYLINVVLLLNGGESLRTFSTEQVQSLVMLSLQNFLQGWEFGLILFGFHLLILGALFLKAGTMRRILGILLLIAALGYIIDGTGKLLIPGYDLSISMFTFPGELVLMIWLLIRGIKAESG